MRRPSRPLVALAAVVVAGAVALGGALALLVPAGRELLAGTTNYGSVLPDLDRPAERSIVYDRFGNVIAVFRLEDRGAPVALADVPQHLVDAVLASEDRHFYEHHGVDWKATARALFRNVEAGGVEQGGSTITQQLVKNTLIDRPERDLRRKIREAWLATRLEQELSKDEILERYLNVIYLGEGAYGVRAAAERYFKKDPKDLTLGESALLAGLIRSPERLDPVDDPDAARARRRQVLDAMVELRMINRQAAAAAGAEPLPTEASSPFQQANDYFVEEVRTRLLADERLGADEEARRNAVLRGGLRIHTTYDPFMQNAAVAAVADGMTDLAPSGYTAALVALDNENGAVRALVGGPGFAQFKYDIATGTGTPNPGRQTGSTFKAITLAAALEAGYSPEDRVNGGPCRLDIPGQAPWSPGGHTSGLAPFRSQLASSINCAFARVAYALGPERIVEMANRLGVRNELQPYYSTTLGTQNTTPLEMATVYSTFAADGVRHDPVFYDRVEDPDGRVLIQEDGYGRQVLGAEIARTETEMLTQVVSSGTGTRARIDRPVAGKTGTTDASTDIWFVGFTPQLTAAVWIGDPFEPRAIPGRYGGDDPAQIFAAFMRAAHAGMPVLDFADPDRSRWPSPQFVDERGRQFRVGLVPTVPPSTTVPPSSAPTSAPPTTVPPTTDPPTTAPPTTAPPTTAPTPAPAPGAPDARARTRR